MKIKKITAFALIAAMTLSCITGCGKDNEESKETGNSEASVFDLMRKEIDNATISMDFSSTENELKNTGNAVISLDKDKFCLDSIKIDGVEKEDEKTETIEIKNLLSGGKDAIYLNIGDLTKSLSSETPSEGSLGMVGMIVPLLFKDVECLKIELPKTEEISTKEIEEEFVKNLENAVKNAGFSFVTGEDGKTFTLKINSIEGFNKLEKELYTQMKASSDVYATYMEASNSSLTSENVKSYLESQLSGIFEEIAKYLDMELTDNNKENLKTNIKTLLENTTITSEKVTKEDAKKQIEEEIDAKIAEIEKQSEGVKNFEVVFVVTDTEDGLVLEMNAKSEVEESGKHEFSIKATIKEGNASVTFPEKTTDLKGIVANVMPVLDSFGALEGLETMKGADEETINMFIDSIFEGLASVEDLESEDGLEVIPY